MVKAAFQFRPRCAATKPTSANNASSDLLGGRHTELGRLINTEVNMTKDETAYLTAEASRAQSNGATVEIFS
jgi:hypothetical protein